jgi:hypothetical protein
MRTKEIKKGIVYNPTIKNEILSYWAIPEESIIASSLRNDKPNLTFVVGSSSDITPRMPRDSSQMICSYELANMHSINTLYFSFDTTTGYRVLTQVPRLR